MDSSISITFSNQASEGVIIEQERWAGQGVVTKLDLVKAISNSVYASEDEVSSDCGLLDGAYASTLYVYPYDRNLVFQIGITWGTLGGGQFSEVEVTENVSFSLTNSKSVTYPIQELISTEFINDPWGDEGQVLDVPTVTVDGQDVTLTEYVYGTVKIVYKTVRYSYTLTIPPREDTVDTAYESVGYVWWDGGVEMKELEPPIGAEYDYATEAKCWSRGQLHMEPDTSPPPLPSGDSNSEYITIDYCSQERVDNE